MSGCNVCVTAGVNDQKMHAEELANLLHHWNLGRHVNIIPYNPIADSDFERPTKPKVSLGSGRSFPSYGDPFIWSSRLWK